MSRRAAVSLRLLAPALWALLAMAASVRAATPDTITVAIESEYAAGWLHQLWFGKGYRDLWATPIALPVLDLSTYAGGLKPVRQVGQLQTPGLALAGADGRSYTFRSLDKEPERSLPIPWRDAWPKRIVRDHTSATHPGAALLLPPLAEAAGVPHTNPILVVMADDSALGVYHATFANDVGTLDEYPRPGVGAFHEATEIISTRELWNRWLQGPENRVDSRAYLRARVLDLLVENYDRHKGQWRWMRLPGHDRWEPLPEDPDMAFIRNEGLGVGAVRSRAPKLVHFRDEFESRLEGPTLNGSEVDRWILTDLDRPAFQAVVQDVRARLTDEAIASAGERLPPEWQPLERTALESALRARRERVLDYLMHYYRDLARQVDVHATNRDDVVSIRRLDGNAIEIEVAPADSSEPYYRRRFLPSETAEVRIYLHGGADRVERHGSAGGPILVRVVAGDGDDLVDDSSGGGTDVWAGAGRLQVRRGPGTSHHDPWTNPEPDPATPWVEPRNWGRWTVVSSRLAYATELDFLLGVAATRSTWGFRSVPEARRDEVEAIWSTGEGRGRLSYSGRFRRPGSRRVLHLDAIGSGIERINFFGFGNETVRPESRDDYRTLEGFITVQPSVRLERPSGPDPYAGFSVRVSDTPTDRSNILNLTDAYGRGSFAETGLHMGLVHDTRREMPSGAFFDTTSGAPGLGDLRLELDGFYFPALLDVERGFGGIEGEAIGYLGEPTDRAQLAARFGGRHVWGSYPWLESSFIGGRASLRGYSRNRFAGDTSLYGGLEARAWIATFDVPPVPLRLGVLGLADVGRVWLEGESSDKWHSSWGAGAMIQPLATPYVVTAAMARSTEQTRFYFGSGFFF